MIVDGHLNVNAYHKLSSSSSYVILMNRYLSAVPLLDGVMLWLAEAN